MNTSGSKRRFLAWMAALVWACCGWVCESSAAPVTAEAIAEDTSVYLGETFHFQIEVSANEQPEAPDISSIVGFSVQPLGMHNSSSESFTVINGRMSRVSKQGYTFNYQLTPRRTGRVVIPAIPVKAGGQLARTQPVTITVSKPAETDNFKLCLELSKTNCYVGESVTVEVVLYTGEPVSEVQFNLPLLDNDSYHCCDPQAEPRPGKSLAVSVGNGTAMAEEGQGVLAGKPCTTLRFRKVLLAKRQGTLAIEPGTAAFQVRNGDPNSRRRGLGPIPGPNGFPGPHSFPRFGDPTKTGFRGKMLIPSNPLQLEVRPLPTEGQPSSFAGHVGSYKISTSATPTEVNVGEPITLTVRLSGPPCLDHIKLPPLYGQAALSNHFKIPADMESGKVSGSSKVFSQTIRARRADVKEIPAVELPYFDTVSQSYQLARSQPIPLTVKVTKVVNARDAEGATPSGSAGQVESRIHGIAHNYEGGDVMRNQGSAPLLWWSSAWGLCLLALLPLGYLVLLVTVFLLLRQRANPQAAQAQQAFGQLFSTLESVSQDDSGMATESVLRALRTYLGDKLRLAPGALTFQDVQEPLRAQGIDAETIQALQAFFRLCDAYRYAGQSDATDTCALIDQCKEVACKLEQSVI